MDLDELAGMIIKTLFSMDGKDTFTG